MAGLRMHGLRPATWATPAARTSPRRAFMPAKPVGAKTTGQVCAWPNSVTGRSTCDLSRIFAPKRSSAGLIGVGSIVLSRGRANDLARTAPLRPTGAIDIARGAGLLPLMAVCAEIACAMMTLPQFRDGVWSRDRRAGANGPREANDGTQR